MDIYQSYSTFSPKALLMPFLAFLFTFSAYSYGHGPLSERNRAVLLHEGTGNTHIQELNTNHWLYSICKNDIEGYTEKLSGTDFKSYPSIRDDVSTSMIVRASTGEMKIEFLTGNVPDAYNGERVSFFLLSDIDLNLNEPFDIFVNDRHLLTFKSQEDGTLEILDNPGGGNASFILVKRDGNHDGIGAFRISMPTHFIVKGERAKIKIRGHKKDSNCWLMIFKADDAVERLKQSVLTEAAFLVKEREGMLQIDAPAHFAGKKVYVVSDGKTSKKRAFKKQGDLAKVLLQMAPPKNNFTIGYDDQSITVAFENGDGVTSGTDIVGRYLYHHVAQYGKGWSASLTKLYKPEFFETYDDFFDREHEDGLVSIMNSSHQDIAWVDRPGVCIILRDTLLLTPVITDAFVREDYGFDIENGLMLREYLERHPGAREKLTTLLKKELISVGATYNCPYEDMYDAEDQVRQLYLGKKWIKKTFGGYDSKVYWNVDVPGKSLQTPQILKKAGVDYMVISRHAKGMFHWQSPDGSSVFTYSPGHYGYDLLKLSQDMDQKIKYGAEQVLFWDRNFENGKVHAPLLSSQDMLPAIDYSDFIETWNHFDALKDDTGKEKPIYLPEMELMTVDEFLPLAEKNVTKIDTIMGERPNVWVYIHGPSHHEALTASREASKLLPAAEKFLSVAHIMDPVKMPYPFEDLEEAWLSKIYPDHGWGGHDGDITDNLFKENLVKSRFMGKNLLDRGIGFIASKIKTEQNLGIPVVLFNSLSWERTDPVTTTINLQKGTAKNLVVLSSDRQEVPAQMANMERYSDGSIKSTDITFLAQNVPSIGYKTYYVQPSSKPAKKVESRANESVYENAHYKVSFAKGGIAQIHDKALNRNLFNTDRFKVGEVFTMKSEGNGAGEFGDVQQPTMEDFDQVGIHKPGWEVVEHGPVFTTYRLSQPIRHAIVGQDVTLYHDLKRVFFNTSLRNWSGEMFREFRTAFPVRMDGPLVTHEVPFGSVRVGLDEIKTAGEWYTPLCKDVHPRAIVDWISASDNDMAITLSSSVAAADWIDPTVDQSDQTVLQHLLLASRTSCHWEGNDYSQEGNHDYHNVLTSHSTDSMEGQRIAKQQNEPLQAVVYPIMSKDAFLPESTSFFGLDKDHVMVTTIKKAEDSEAFIVRMYNTSDKVATVDLTSHFPIARYDRTNIIEEDPEPVSEMEVGKFAIETFSMEMRK